MSGLGRSARAGLAVCAALVAGCGGSDGGEPTSPPRPRAADDVRAASQLNIQLVVDPHARFGGEPPAVADVAAPSLSERSCVVISPDPEGGARELILPPGGAVIEAAEGAPADLRLGRGDTRSFPIDVGRVAAGGRALLRIPRDGVERPWHLAVRSREMMSVCGRP